MIFAEPGEPAERLEELFSLAQRNDEVIIRREGEAIAALRTFREDFDQSSDRLWPLMAERRPADDSTTSHHDEFYDENGLLK